MNLTACCRFVILSLCLLGVEVKVETEVSAYDVFNNKPIYIIRILHASYMTIEHRNTFSLCNHIDYGKTTITHELVYCT